MKVKVKSLSRVRLSDPMDYSLPGSSIHGIFQARVLEWGARLHIFYLGFNIFKNVWQILKAAREKQQTHKGIPIRITADLSTETLQARREWQDILKVMKENNLQPRLLYPARISLQIWRRNQKLYRQAKAERIQHHQTSSPTNAKGSSLDRKHRKGVSTQTQNNKVDGNGTILINNYLKCKWVECPNQKTKTGWMDTKTRPLCYLQETHLKPRDTYRLKVKGWKKIFHANRDQKKAGVAILISE